MNRRPGQLKVTTEPGYCSFCDRTRNLRKEERQLGALVRTVTTCESCHRTVASTMGVADAESPAAIEAHSGVANGSSEQPVTTGPKAARRAPARKAAPAAGPKTTKPRASKGK